MRRKARRVERRVGTLNIVSMTEKGRKVSDMTERNILCAQDQVEGKKYWRWVQIVLPWCACWQKKSVRKCLKYEAGY